MSLSSSEQGLLVNRFRKAHELWGAFGWFGASGTIVVFQYTAISQPDNWSGIAVSAIVATSYLGVIRAYSGLNLWIRRAKLFGGRLIFWSPDKLLKVVKSKKNKDLIFIGMGFDWKQEHAQSAMLLDAKGIDAFRPPIFAFWLNNLLYGEKVRYEKTPHKRFKGKTWIQGMGKEVPIFMKKDELKQHLAITGTTGSGKTRMYELLLTQMIHSGVDEGDPETLYVIDPKGDFELFQRMFIEARRAGREDDLVFFSLAQPKFSVRLDPVKNWVEVSEIASRIEAILPSQEAGGDTFTKFAWDVVNSIAGAQVFLGIRPTLASITSVIDTSVDDLTKEVILAHCDRCDIEGWRQQYLEYVAKVEKDPRAYERPSSNTPNEVVAAVYYYQQVVKMEHEHFAVNNIISQYQHNRVHAGKMLAVLKPILKTLTSGSVRELLSPETAPRGDYRPAWDNERIISQRKICYININSMGDQTVSTAVGSIMLADILSVLASRYNHGIAGNHKVNILVDESSEIVNKEMISILNKGRGAGANVVFATQTSQDLVVRLGTEEQKDQVAGNANNLLSSRVIDQSTKEFVSERVGPTTIRTIQSSIGTNAMSSDKDVSNFTGSYGDRSTDDPEGELFPMALLDDIPDLEFIGVISAGRVVKFQVPLLTKTKEEEALGYKDLPWIKRELANNSNLSL